MWSTYKVVWEIDIDAKSPMEAAKEALRIQRDRDSIATVFVVNGQEIDLSTTTEVEA